MSQTHKFIDNVSKQPAVMDDNGKVRVRVHFDFYPLQSDNLSTSEEQDCEAQIQLESELKELVSSLSNCSFIMNANQYVVWQATQQFKELIDSIKKFMDEVNVPSEGFVKS